jgi:uncharacterized protein
VREISEQEIIERLYFDNPWWAEPGDIDLFYQNMPYRAYLKPFRDLLVESNVNRALILLGPRRVGKTVLVYQTIQYIIDSGVDGKDILYVSLETPIYTGLALEKLINIYKTQFKHSKNSKLYIFFDEIQYFKDWEIHLKSLVDSYRNHKFIATGSAAAALRLKSRESGAGRFTEFLLPPLTFAEYLQFTGKEDELISTDTKKIGDYTTSSIETLNEEFLRYLNFGGYPEAIFSPVIQSDSSRYIKSDIIDKVLLRDLPSLYGISDIQELNRLFTTIAYNSGDEVSLEGLSQSSGVAKNTIKKYLEYLEAAFLIRRINRIDKTAKRFERATTFKVYLTNPSMRAALFGPVNAKSDAIGSLTETAIFSQWFHNTVFVDNIYYARWKSGEVDIVACDPASQKPSWVVEVKWSDRQFANPGELLSVAEFIENNDIKARPLVTSYSKSGVKKIRNIMIRFTPSSLYCYTVGKNLVRSVTNRLSKLAEKSGAD